MAGHSLSLGTFQKQVLKQQLSAEMKLSFKLLQMNRIDLESYLKTEADENPFLYLEEHDSSERYIPPPRNTFGAPAPDDDWIDRVPDREQGLYQSILNQIVSSGWPDTLIQETTALVPHLDDHGFLPEFNPIDGLTQEQYVDAVRQFQRLDPPGLGARSPRESLLLQSAAIGMPMLVDQLIESHLEMLADGDTEAILKATGASEEELREAIRLLRTLSPYPVNFSNPDIAQLTRPDVVVEERNGSYVVAGNKDNQVSARIDDNYRTLTRDPNLTREQKKKLREQYRKAQNLLSFCDLRDSTLIRVAQILVRHQEEFLRQGRQALKPLALKNVAEELSLHESTISRAAQGKTMLTDRGLIPFRNFFVQSVSENREGDEVVGSAVQEAITALMEQEAHTRRNKPYTDQELVALLETQDLAVARRTVAKYRGLLNIPSRAERRKQYKLENFTRGSP